MAYTYGKQVSDGSPRGLGVGQSATDLVGFFGKTARVQVTAATSIAATATTAILKTAINKINNALKNLGITA